MLRALRGPLPCRVRHAALTHRPPTTATRAAGTSNVQRHMCKMTGHKNHKPTWATALGPLPRPPYDSRFSLRLSLSCCCCFSLSLSGLSMSARPPCISCISLSCSGSMLAIILGKTTMMSSVTPITMTIGFISIADHWKPSRFSKKTGFATSGSSGNGNGTGWRLCVSSARSLPAAFALTSSRTIGQMLCTSCTSSRYVPGRTEWMTKLPSCLGIAL
mmetsp:Transcript_21331/g.57445  ORF Transcript_21331/g.57445 Transcript_21331/m.57445 type:complete len:217 (-) Transcript_21331:181-831(-)